MDSVMAEILIFGFQIPLSRAEHRRRGPKGKMWRYCDCLSEASFTESAHFEKRRIKRDTGRLLLVRFLGRSRK
jgi:hypothetical protein